MGLNPVERRLVELQSRWQGFLADSSKRMLLWQVPDNATRLLECFFAAQRHQVAETAAYVGSDTFIVFDAPFVDSIGYSRRLKEALAGQYEASHEMLEQAGEKPDWHFFPNALADSATGFVQGLNALAQHHQAVLGLLVAVFLPNAVNGEAAWTAWLGRALEAQPGPGVRLLVVDTLENPRCGGLLDVGYQALQTEVVPMDAWELAGETFAQEAAVGAPGVFRSLLTGLFSLVEKGSVDQVMTKASDAIAFARRQGWLDQEFTVRMLTAGAMLKERRFEEAANHYRHARTTAEKLTTDNHPAGRDLELQTWFGEASVWFAMDNLAQAIRCYTAAEKVAEAIPKPILWLESLRMAAFCHARLDEVEAAAQCCERALQVGERMKPEARPMTTLPLVAMEALRLLEPKRTAKIEAVKQRLEDDLARLHDEVEQAAAGLESDPKANEGLLKLERACGDKTDQLTGAAEREIDTLTTAGEPRFIKALQHMRGLLWRSWPLDPVEEEAAAEDTLAVSEGSHP